MLPRVRILATEFARVMHQALPSSIIEGAGKTGWPLHPGPPRKKNLRERALTTGTGGISPAFPAQWFTAYSVLSSVNQLVCHRHLRETFVSRTLGACMGAPGPHDFTVREARCSSVSALASTAARLTFRDDRDTPLCNRGGMGE